ncbi:MAG: monovalent cation/H(+) antiporter subunit G [Pseudomonadota bacterium]|nr:MAG: cation:proton antiporter [Pseudomonadota bacterium]
MSALQILGTVVMMLGSFLFLVAAMGIVRLPDVYCRSHALGKATTLGIMLLLVGYGLRVPEASWLKILLIVLFQMVTVPVAAHLFCLMAYRKGIGR